MQKMNDTMYCVKSTSGRAQFLPYTMSWDEDFTKRAFMEETQMCWEEALEKRYQIVKVKVEEL